MSEDKDAAQLLDRLDTALALISEKLDEYGPEVIELALVTIRTYSIIMTISLTLMMCGIAVLSAFLWRHGSKGLKNPHSDGFEVLGFIGSGVCIFFIITIFFASSYIFYFISAINPLMGLAFRALQTVGLFQ